MNTCLFTIHFKKTSVCSKVFVECIIYFGELEEASSYSLLLLLIFSQPLNPETSHNTKKLTRVCNESLWYFDTLGS